MHTIEYVKLCGLTIVFKLPLFNRSETNQLNTKIVKPLMYNLLVYFYPSLNSQTCNYAIHAICPNMQLIVLAFRLLFKIPGTAIDKL